MGYILGGLPKSTPGDNLGGRGRFWEVPHNLPVYKMNGGMLSEFTPGNPGIVPGPIGVYKGGQLW